MTIVAPYAMVAAWDPTVVITRIRCHRLVAESLRRVLQGVLTLYMRQAGVKAALGSGAYASPLAEAALHLLPNKRMDLSRPSAAAAALILVPGSAAAAAGLAGHP